MKFIPAKTFLLGEYAALQGESALILTTKPCFEFSISNTGANPFHPDSPAGRLINNQNLSCTWKDPYQGLGGLGASSAEFLGCYMALYGSVHDNNHLLETYYQHTTSPSGLKPSGYDVLAQSLSGCVFINKNKNQIETYVWPFKNLSFLLVHTRKKLATHEHLQQKKIMPDVRLLSALADKGREAFIQTDETLLIDTVQSCYTELSRQNLVASHTQEFVEHYKNHPDILAIKGCGALGADVILLLVRGNSLVSVKNLLEKEAYIVLADTQDVYTY